jgi:FKBP-type peptidyl-prolyl cis-trans isomerase FklB
MKVGERRRLTIPAALAYGAQGSPPKIGPNEPLIFDIDLKKIG